jgi:hypothetical protein
MIFRLLPPSIRVLGRKAPLTMVLTTSGYVPVVRDGNPMIFPEKVIENSD